MENILIFVFVILGVLITIGMIWGSVLKGRNQEIEAAFAELGVSLPKDFFVNNALLTDGNRRGFVMVDNNSLYKLTYSDEKYNVKKLAPTDILEVEVFEDGDSITKAKTGSAAGRAVLGGLVLGPIGLVAGLTGKKTTQNRVASLDLRVVLNEMEDPVFDINIFTSLGQPVERNFTYEAHLKTARTWAGRFSAFMNQAEEAA